MKLVKLIVIILILTYLFGCLSVVISNEVIKSKIAYKKALVSELYDSRPIGKKFDAYYNFNTALEIAKYNAWLTRMQYLNSSMVGIWIPDEIDNEKYFQ